MHMSAPQPRSRKTPRGGRMTAKKILQMSLLFFHVSQSFFHSAPRPLWFDWRRMSQTIPTYLAVKAILNVYLMSRQRARGKCMNVVVDVIRCFDD